MNKIIISTESTADLPDNIKEKYNIKMLDMHFEINQVEFSNNAISSKEFYSVMRNDAIIHTSQVNQYEAKEFFEDLLNQGYDVVHIGFSKNLSGTYNSCNKAINELNKKYGERIILVDSLGGCSGQGLLAILTCDFNNGNKTLKEVAEYASNICLNISYLFIVDNLKYLARTGRINKIVAKLGSILQIKPILHADNEGKLNSIQKVISRKKALQVLSHKVVQTKNNLSNIIFVSHADCENDALLVANNIEQNLHIKPIITNICNVMGAHCGPGTVAVFFTSNKRQ